MAKPDPGVNKLTQRYRAQRIEVALHDLVKAIDEIRTDLGDKYPALSEAYVKAKTALALE